MASRWAPHPLSVLLQWWTWCRQLQPDHRPEDQARLSTNKRPKGKRKEAEEKCKDFRESPKMRTKCIFDYMMMGPAALKDSKKDRMEQRKGSMKKPTDRSVRDLSTFRSD